MWSLVVSNSLQFVAVPSPGAIVSFPLVVNHKYRKVAHARFIGHAWKLHMYTYAVILVWQDVPSIFRKG